MISQNTLALALMLASTAPVAAFAQEAPPPERHGQASASAKGHEAPTNEEIIVTGRFIDTGAKSAMKMPVSVLDTAATVSSYSSSFVKSLDTTTVSDLYNYMTGLKKSGNTGYDITLRGFKGSGDDRNTILVDGLPGLTVRYGSPGTVNIDHIELVQGPTSVLYGQAQPGGFVNLVTKSPLGHFEASVEQRVNSYAGSGLPLGRRNGIEDEFDVTGPITRSGNLLFRVTGQISDIQSFRDGALASSSEFIAPALTWKINPGTSLTVKAEYGHVRQHLDNGVVAPANGNIYDVSRAAPRTASYQQPDDFRGETGKTVSAFLHHDFGGGWQFHASYRHVSYNSDQKSFDQYGTLTVQGVAEVQRRARELVTNRSYDYGDINLNGHFKTGFIKHKILIGLNLGSNSTENNRIKFFNSSTPDSTTGKCPTGGTCLNIPVYNPSAYYSSFPSFDSLPAINTQLGAAAQKALLTDQLSKTRSYGIYVSDLMELAPWLKVSIAGRNFAETSKVAPDLRNLPGVSYKRTDRRNLLPSAGVLIEPTRHMTVYASYSESFVPSDPSALDGNGNVGTLNPVTAKQYELGLKGENLFQRRLSFTAALYRIDQDGQVTTNPCIYGTCSYQTGKGRSDGFEVQGDASPFENLQLLFGYSHIIAKIRTSPNLPFQVGDVLPNVARDAANLWSRYNVGHGLGLGLGIVYTGPRQGVLPTSASDTKLMPLPGYVVVDTGIYYDINRWSINLKIGNLFDKTYIESAGATGRIQAAYGQPRNLTLSVKVKL